jgi:hypothetical protein
VVDRSRVGTSAGSTSSSVFLFFTMIPINEEMMMDGISNIHFCSIKIAKRKNNGDIVVFTELHELR